MSEQTRKNWSGDEADPAAARSMAWALIGALVYYVQQAHGFWGLCWASQRPLLWPPSSSMTRLKSLGS